MNMGNADRTIRILIVIAIAVLLLTDSLSGILAVILAIVAAAFLLTSSVGFCPLDTPLKISTKKSTRNA